MFCKIQHIFCIPIFWCALTFVVLQGELLSLHGEYGEPALPLEGQHLYSGRQTLSTELPGKDLKQPRSFSNTLPGSLTWPLKISHPKRKVIFKPSFFRGYVKLRGCKVSKTPPESWWLYTWKIGEKSWGYFPQLINRLTWFTYKSPHEKK